MAIYDRASGEEYVKHVLEATGAKNKVYDSDLDGLIDSVAIEKVNDYENLLYDTTVYTTTSTTYEELNRLESSDYKYRIGTYHVVIKFRTTGSATAYVRTDARILVGSDNFIVIRGHETSTTSTTTTSAIFRSTYCAVEVFYSTAFILYFKTSDSSVAAEVSEQKVNVIWGKLVKP